MELSAKLLSRIQSYSKVPFDHFDRFLPSFLLKIDEPTNSIYKKSEIWPAGIQKILNVPWKKALRSFFNGHLVQVQRTPLFNILKQSFYKYLLVVSSILLSFYKDLSSIIDLRFTLEPLEVQLSNSFFLSTQSFFKDS